MDEENNIQANTEGYTLEPDEREAERAELIARRENLLAAIGSKKVQVEKFGKRWMRAGTLEHFNFELRLRVLLHRYAPRNDLFWDRRKIKML